MVDLGNDFALAKWGSSEAFLPHILLQLVT